jgi:hypothetical protein
LVVGLPAKAQINAPIFWTVVKSISILGSYVGYVHCHTHTALRQRDLTMIIMTQESTRRARSPGYRCIRQDQVPPRDQAVGDIGRVGSFLFARESWLFVDRCCLSFRVYEGMEQGKVVGRVVLNMK